MPLRRYIFNTLTVVSLLLLLGTVGLWVDSYWHGTLIVYETESEFTFSIHNDSGGLVRFSITDWSSLVSVGSSTSQGWMLRHTRTDIPFEFPESLYFGWFNYHWNYVDSLKVRYYELTIPNWFLTLIFAVLPAIWLFKWNKRRKLGPNACPSCGYDLTGNESGECPECGETTKAEAAQT